MRPVGAGRGGSGANSYPGPGQAVQQAGLPSAGRLPPAIPGAGRTGEKTGLSAVPARLEEAAESGGMDRLGRGFETEASGAGGVQFTASDPALGAVRNLASHVLSLATSRLAEDWEARWKVRPALIETFVDGSLHEGTIYVAAGWEKIGQSSGRRGSGPKDLHVKELQGDARAVLRGKRRTRERKQAAIAAATPADGTQLDCDTN